MLGFVRKRKIEFSAALIKFQTIELQIEHVLKLIEEKMEVIMGRVCELCHRRFFQYFTSLKDLFFILRQENSHSKDFAIIMKNFHSLLSSWSYG